MENTMKAIIKMIKNMDGGYYNGPMENNLKVNGIKENRKGLEKF